MERKFGAQRIGGSAHPVHRRLRNFKVRNVNFHINFLNGGIARRIGNGQSDNARIGVFIRPDVRSQTDHLIVVIENAVAVFIHGAVQIPVSIHNFAVAVERAFRRKFASCKNGHFHRAVAVVHQNIRLGIIGTHLRIEKHIVRNRAPCSIGTQTASTCIVSSVFPIQYTSPLSTRMTRSLPRPKLMSVFAGISICVSMSSRVTCKTVFSMVWNTTPSAVSNSPFEEMSVRFAAFKSFIFPFVSFTSKRLSCILGKTYFPSPGTVMVVSELAWKVLLSSPA